jgi:hypothetical protein
MSTTVSALKFEHHRDALGIGESAPRLSWIVTDAPPGWRQARYEIQSGSESVTVDSGDSVLVPWPFAGRAPP